MISGASDPKSTDSKEGELAQSTVRADDKGSQLSRGSWESMIWDLFWACGQTVWTKSVLSGPERPVVAACCLLPEALCCFWAGAAEVPGARPSGLASPSLILQLQLNLPGWSRGTTIRAPPLASAVIPHGLGRDSGVTASGPYVWRCKGSWERSKPCGNRIFNQFSMVSFLKKIFILLGWVGS